MSSRESERPNAADEALTPRLGFLAMISFLESFFERAGPDVATLMTDLTIQPDGQPLDPAAWNDWLHAIEIVRSHER